MDVHEAIKNRRSIRRYRDEPVPDDKLSKVLEAARLAPSASNRQQLRYVVVTDKQTRHALVDACKGQQFVGQAGAVIVACSTEPTSKWHLVDAAIAVDHMTLAAHAEGLGTCWIGAFEEERVKPILGIPPEVKVVVLLPLGVPDTKGVERPRKSAEELFCHDRW